MEVGRRQAATMIQTGCNIDTMFAEMDNTLIEIRKVVS